MSTSLKFIVGAVLTAAGIAGIRLTAYSTLSACVIVVGAVLVLAGILSVVAKPKNN